MLLMKLAAVSQLVLLVLLSGATPARLQQQQQQLPRYFCSPAQGQPLTITDAQFELVTRYNASQYVMPNMRCEFRISSPQSGRDGSGFYYVEVLDNPTLQVSQASLTVRDSTGQVLASASDRGRVPAERTILITRTNSLSVAMETTSRFAAVAQLPVRMRVRRFINCPPGWTAIDGYCFSPVDSDGSSSRQLSFASAQLACNSMRSNLLMMSFRNDSSALGKYTVTQFVSQVLHYPTGAWIGLTDIARGGRGPLNWLDGTRLLESLWPDGLRCSSSLYWPSVHCLDTELCAYVRPAGSVAYSGIVMDTCQWSSRQFACYMPKNGTDVFYPVPRLRQNLLIWLLPTVVVFAFICFCLILVAMRRRRLHQRRRHQLLGPAGSCCSSAAAAASQPIPGGYDAYGQPVPQWYGGQVQQHQQQYYQPPPLPHQHAQYQTFGGAPVPQPPPYYPQQQQQPQCRQEDAKNNCCST